MVNIPLIQHPTIHTIIIPSKHHVQSGQMHLDLNIFGMHSAIMCTIKIIDRTKLVEWEVVILIIDNQYNNIKVNIMH